MSYVVIAELESLPDSVDRFRELLLQHATNSTALEPGCLVFDVCQEEDKPRLFLLFEVYKDADAYQRHREMPSYKNFMTLAKPLFHFVSRRVLQRLVHQGANLRDASDFQTWPRGSEGERRFPLMQMGDLDALQLKVIRGEANTRLQGKDGNGLAGQVGFQVNHPDMLAAYLPLALHSKRDCLLPPDVRELVIMLAARLWSCPYLWSSHEAMASDAGLTDATLEALSSGRKPSDLNPACTAVFGYCLEFWKQHAVSDGTFKVLREHLDVKQSLDVIAVLGFYTMVAMFTNTNELGETRDSRWPLTAREHLF